MPRDPQKAQAAGARKEAMRLQKRSASHQPVAHGAGGLRQAGIWPLYEVLLSEQWKDPETLVSILVSRRSPQGKIAAAVFLVDLACLGVKSATARIYKSWRDYDEDMRERITSAQPMKPASLNLVAKIIAAGVEYAQRLSIVPDPVYYQAKLLLADADPAACSDEIPLGGPEGKPLFVAGPYDNVPLIMAKLTRAVGADGFHYLIATDPGAGAFDEP